jgi:hypothetical protein
MASANSECKTIFITNLLNARSLLVFKNVDVGYAGLKWPKVSVEVFKFSKPFFAGQCFYNER